MTDDNERTCDFEGCTTQDPKILSGGGRYCRSDHTAAGRNGWSPDELEGFYVEYDGYKTIYLAPSREQAERQWRSHVIASDDPHRTQPTVDELQTSEGTNA